MGWCCGSCPGGASIPMSRGGLSGDTLIYHEHHTHYYHDNHDDSDNHEKGGSYGGK